MSLWAAAVATMEHLPLRQREPVRQAGYAVASAPLTNTSPPEEYWVPLAGSLNTDGEAAGSRRLAPAVSGGGSVGAGGLGAAAPPSASSGSGGSAAVGVRGSAVRAGRAVNTTLFRCVSPRSTPNR
jgi:hypothetical protein